MYLAVELAVVFIIELVLILFIESKRDKYREVLVIRPSKKYYFVGVLGSLFSIWTYHFMINISQNDLERKLSVIAAVFFVCLFSGAYYFKIYKDVFVSCRGFGYFNIQSRFFKT